MSNNSVTTIKQEKRNAWRGRKIEVSKLAKFMDQASKDCIEDGKRHKFPVLLPEQQTEDRTGRRILRDAFEEDSDSDDEIDELRATNEFDDEETENSPNSVVLTRLYKIYKILNLYNRYVRIVMSDIPCAKFASPESEISPY